MADVHATPPELDEDVPTALAEAGMITLPADEDLRDELLAVR